MRQIEKKVTKKLAMEIAAKFYGRTVQPKDQNFGYVFIEGLIKLEVFQYYQDVSESVLSEKYPYCHAYINSENVYSFFYIEGKLYSIDYAPYICEKIRRANQ
ncbi:MAG: hypothetical protein ACI4MB_01525 [Candidatus Coproplasma sp.]